MKNYYSITSYNLSNFKYWLLISFVFILSTTKGISQVNSYTFSESLVGYTPLVGGTVAYAAPWDNETSAQVTLPFSFTYNYNPVTQFYISANGFISFGAIQPVATNYLPMQTATAHTGVVSALGTNLVSNGSDIVYDVIGVAPNRTMVVQWTNAVRAASGGDFNFQIRLNGNHCSS